MSNAPDGAVWRLQLAAGPHARRQAPLVLEAPEGAAAGVYALSGGGVNLTAQVAHGRVLAVLPALEAGEEREYTLEAATAAPQVLAEAAGGGVSVRIGAQAFTTLQLEGAPKPYLYPLLGPGGVSVVRGFPTDPQPGDSTDHPHHRGAWIGHGDVNGADSWEERPGRVGRIVADSLAASSGSVAAHVAAELRWCLPDGTPVALERRLYRFWAEDDAVRLLDMESVYRGVDGGAVRFGDTKEGALCGIRVATGMEGSRGGRITTSEGALGEAEAWGSAAGWCDYSGVPAAERAAGRDGVLGVAILGSPANAIHPMRWHVRDYGLMTANPFALSHYLPRRGLDGSHTIAAGAEAGFRFRLVLHRGGAAEAELARRYADWAFPPRARWQRA